MKSIVSFALVVSAVIMTADCHNSINFSPTYKPNVNRHNINNVHPSTNVSLNYGSNTSVSSNINVNHAMKYPTVVLEDIIAIANVTCSSTSVVITFNDSSVFVASQTAWSAQGTFVMVTNHFGNCDAELERGIFLVNGLNFNVEALICTASSTKSDVADTAVNTQISFGGIPASGISTRDTKLDPTYTVETSIALPNSTTLYTYSPYLTVEADSASVSATVTFSGYLDFNWLGLKVEELYFDIDADFEAEAELSAAVTSAYDATFTYSPSTLAYIISVPGIISIGPELKFAIGAEVSASEAVDITTALAVSIPDGTVHVDLLNQAATTTSGWTPRYAVSAAITGDVATEINPFVALTVELSIIAFSGLVDLSTGVTAKPGFTNTFLLTAAEAVDLSGFKNVTSSGTCAQGLALESDFTFAIDAFVTQWWSEEVYSVTVPLLEECYTWQ